MKNVYTILTNAISKKGYVNINPLVCSNKVFKFIEKNTDVLNTTILDNGFIKIELK